jgi:transketolase
MDDLHRLAVNTIRMLAVDAVEKAGSGHPGMPMGIADCAFVLWHEYLKFNPKDPDWPNRDRFILSAGHGSMLLYGLLHLYGFDLTIDDIKRFRQLGSVTPGHPENCIPGVETTTGPLGQGFANGVGMAIAQKIMYEKFNGKDFTPISHRIYGIVSDGDLMEGISSETASIAGHLGLGNIIYIYDDNRITIDGGTEKTFSEDVGMRFQAFGWHTVRIDGHDRSAITKAIQEGIDEEEKPTLILARTHIGYKSPKQDDSSSHGSPLGEEEVIATKENLGWPLEPTFYVPEEVYSLFENRVEDLKKEYNTWEEDFSAWQQRHPRLAGDWQKMLKKEMPDDIADRFLKAIPTEPHATRIHSGSILQEAAEIIPGLYGGSADLGSSVKTFIQNEGDIGSGQFSGRNLHFGIREHGMGGIINGMALYGGFIPYGSTFFVFSDYMRPSIRLSAIMEIQVIWIFSHDSIFVGEDGPTHQPIEHLASLRAIPNLIVMRPADGIETAMCWAHALEEKERPTALILTRQRVPNLDRPKGFNPKKIQKGGYILSKESGAAPDFIVVATGSEVGLAVECKEILESEGKSVRLVSMPSLDIFQEQPEKYRNTIIPHNDTPVVVVEAGVAQGWYGLTRARILFIGMDRFGESAPHQDLVEKFGFTVEKVVEKIRNWMDWSS